MGIEDDVHPTKVETDRLAWTLAVRPGVLGEVLTRLLRREAPRMIVQTRHDVRLYVDPLSHLGHEVITTGDYEAEVAREFERLVRPGAIVVDIGANEGALTCLAAKLAGPEGRVIAVEPQRRLLDVLEINRALNGLANVRIENAALSDAPSVEIWLYPTLNSGASSIVSKYRWSRRRQATPTLSFAALVKKHSLPRLDLIKIDVEGYEKEIVNSLAPVLAATPLRRLLIEYHGAILRARGVSAADIDAKLRSCGLRHIAGQSDLEGYALYAGADFDDAVDEGRQARLAAVDGGGNG